MISRRDVLIGGSCLVAAGAAYALEPRGRLSLLKGVKLADIVPINIGEWSAESSDSLVEPSEGSLTATLYSEVVGRIYHHPTGAGVMMLAAYGDTQSDLLQLHRPESCYPAVGFKLVSTKVATLPVAKGVTVPTREVVVTAPGRQESIVYWTRIGEYLPVTGGEQRDARLRTAMAGYVPDGILMRFSAVGENSEEIFKMLDGFIPHVIQAVPRQYRKALIGTALATAMPA